MPTFSSRTSRSSPLHRYLPACLPAPLSPPTPYAHTPAPAVERQRALTTCMSVLLCSLLFSFSLCVRGIVCWCDPGERHNADAQRRLRGRARHRCVYYCSAAQCSARPAAPRLCSSCFFCADEIVRPLLFGACVSPSAAACVAVAGLAEQVRSRMGKSRGRTSTTMYARVWRTAWQGAARTRCRSASRTRPMRRWRWRRRRGSSSSSCSSSSSSSSSCYLNLRDRNHVGNIQRR